MNQNPPQLATVASECADGLWPLIHGTAARFWFGGLNQTPILHRQQPRDPPPTALPATAYQAPSSVDGRQVISGAETRRRARGKRFHPCMSKVWEAGGILCWWINVTRGPGAPSFVRIAAENESIADKNESPSAVERARTTPPLMRLLRRRRRGVIGRQLEVPAEVPGPIWRDLVVVLHASFRCEPFEDAGMQDRFGLDLP